MTEVGGIAADRLRSLIERIERLEEEKKALSGDIRDVFAEAKSPILENFILSVLRVPQYRLVTSFDPTIVDEKMITVFSMIAGPMIAILFIGLIVIFNSKIKKNLIYKV